MNRDTPAHPSDHNPIRLPDDIEERLLSGQKQRAIRDLMTRRRINRISATMAVTRWVADHSPAS